MIQLSTRVLILVGTLFSASSGLCESPQNAPLPQAPIQDTAKAAEYFENELSFKTNAHGVKSVVDGKTKNVTIVDVRAAKDFAEGHIPGAINIPYDQYNSFGGPETDFPGLKKDGFNYIYCYVHSCNLSQKAAKKFASLGYPVKEIVGGYKTWKDDQYPIEK